MEKEKQIFISWPIWMFIIWGGFYHCQTKLVWVKVKWDFYGILIFFSFQLLSD